MSITPLAGDIMTIGNDSTLANIHKKINELVGASNDDFDRIYKVNNEITLIKKEIRDIKMRINNLG
jgi:hypothetical protein